MGSCPRLRTSPGDDTGMQWSGWASVTRIRWESVVARQSGTQTPAGDRRWSIPGRRGGKPPTETDISRINPRPFLTPLGSAGA
jgi:hypothetical protein